MCFRCQESKDRKKITSLIYLFQRYSDRQGETDFSLFFFSFQFAKRDLFKKVRKSDFCPSGRRGLQGRKDPETALSPTGSLHKCVQLGLARLKPGWSQEFYLGLDSSTWVISFPGTFSRKPDQEQCNWDLNCSSLIYYVSMKVLKINLYREAILPTM